MKPVHIYLKGQKKKNQTNEKNPIQYFNASYLQLKDHVEHSIWAIGFQQLHDMGVFQHVTDAGLPLQVWKESKRKQKKEWAKDDRAKTP